MKISVIIVSYNVKEYLSQCLDSLLKSLDGIESEVFVVDNHSKDGTIPFIKKRFHSIKYISCNHNMGFAKANNLAIKQCTGNYILLLNPDTIVGENVIRKALNFMDSHPQAGGAGVRMLKVNGSPAKESRRGIPTPMTAFYKMCGLCTRYPESKKFGRYYMSFLSWGEPAKIQIISGAFFLLRHSAIDKVGLLDEDYFMYGEDIDISYRLLKSGYDNWYLPLSVLHYKGESTQKSSFRYVHVFYEAMLIFFKKHYRNFSLLISIPIKTAIVFRAFIALLNIQFNRVKKILGFFDFRHNKLEDLYVIVCRKSSLESCKQIAFNKGLDAKFIIGDEISAPNGYRDVVDEYAERRNVCVVYDTHGYSYEHMLRIMANNVNCKVEMGTYNPQTHTIITRNEIFK